jgi:hypothetical protein
VITLDTTDFTADFPSPPMMTPEFRVVDPSVMPFPRSPEVFESFGSLDADAQRISPREAVDNTTTLRLLDDQPRPISTVHEESRFSGTSADVSEESFSDHDVWNQTVADANTADAVVAQSFPTSAFSPSTPETPSHSTSGSQFASTSAELAHKEQEFYPLEVSPSPHRRKELAIATSKPAAVSPPRRAPAWTAFEEAAGMTVSKRASITSIDMYQRADVSDPFYSAWKHL